MGGLFSFLKGQTGTPSCPKRISHHWRIFPRWHADRDAFRPFATYLALIAAARDLTPAKFAWRTEPYEFEAERPAIDLLLGREDLRPMLEAGASLEDLERSWSDDLAEFDETRRQFLLY